MTRHRVVLKSLEELMNTKGVIFCQNNIGFENSHYSFPNEFLLRDNRGLIINSEGYTTSGPQYKIEKWMCKSWEDISEEEELFIKMGDYFISDNFGADLTISAGEYDFFKDFGLIEATIQNEEGEHSVVLNENDIMNLKIWIDTMLNLAGGEENV